MIRSPGRLALPALLSLVLAAGCGRDAAAPGGSGGPALLAVRPLIQASAAYTRSGLSVDQIRVRVLHPDETTALDTLIAFPATQSRLQIQLAVPLKTSPETLSLQLTLLGAGQPLFAGSGTAALRAGGSGPQPAQISLFYVGPGGGAARVVLAPRDVFLATGDSVPFSVSGVDSSGSALAGVYVRWSSGNPAVVSVDANGVERAGGPRGLAMVHATALSGAADSVAVTVGPLGQAAILFAGDSAGIPRGVYRVNPDATALARVAEGGATQNSWPRWAPTFTRLAFGAPNANTNLIAVASYNGLSRADVANDVLAAYPAFSPNGRHFAFRCGASATLRDLCEVDDVTGPITGLAGRGNSGARRVLSSLVPSRPAGSGGWAWDPMSGDTVVFSADTIVGNSTYSGLYFVRYDGTGLRPIANVANNMLTWQADVAAPIQPLRVENVAWTPDGSTLVFSAQVDTLTGRALFSMRRDGTGLTELTTPGAGTDDGLPVISPDGRTVLFFRAAIFGGRVTAGDWFRLDLGSRTLTQATNEGSNFVNVPSLAWLGADWSPDGSQAVITGTRNGATAVYVIRATTTAATYATDGRLVSPGGP